MPTSDDVKNGFEQIHDFTLGGLVPPLKMTPEDHEGGGLVQVWQVKGGKLVAETDWFRAYPRRGEEAGHGGGKRILMQPGMGEAAGLARWTTARRCWRSTTSRWSMTA